MAARFLNRIAALGTTFGVGGLVVQESIYDG
jgi:TPP-dependent 2-oxoacid decarboxylase